MRRVVRFCRCGRIRHRKRKYCAVCIRNRVWSKGVPSGRRIYALEDAGTAKVRRRVLLEQRGHRCELCRRRTWCGKPIPLDTDHIDGDSENHASANLRLVCLNCHGQTPTFRNRNRGHGRVGRMARYRAGKSY